MKTRYLLKHYSKYALLCLGLFLLYDGCYIYAKAQLAQYLISDAWEHSLSSHQPVKPWPWADTWPVARLRIKDNTLYVLDGANGASLAFGPGHVSASAYPGETGNSIIAGHRDTHFQILEQVKTNDEISIQNRSGAIVHYKVSDIRIADSTKQSLHIDQQAQQITLVTCYPFDAINPGGPLRYVVTASRITDPLVSRPNRTIRL